MHSVASGQSNSCPAMVDAVAQGSLGVSLAHDTPSSAPLFTFRTQAQGSSFDDGSAPRRLFAFNQAH